MFRLHSARTARDTADTLLAFPAQANDFNGLTAVRLVLRGRIELPTSSLPMMCSTTELPQHLAGCGGLCHKSVVSASVSNRHFPNLDCAKAACFLLEISPNPR